jgi:hypothetical protein
LKVQDYINSKNHSIAGKGLYKGTAVGHKNCFEMYPFAKSNYLHPIC